MAIRGVNIGGVLQAFGQLQASNEAERRRREAADARRRQGISQTLTAAGIIGGAAIGGPTGAQIGGLIGGAAAPAAGGEPLTGGQVALQGAQIASGLISQQQIDQQAAQKKLREENLRLQNERLRRQIQGPTGQPTTTLLSQGDRAKTQFLESQGIDPDLGVTPGITSPEVLDRVARFNQNVDLVLTGTGNESQKRQEINALSPKETFADEVIEQANEDGTISQVLIRQRFLDQRPIGQPETVTVKKPVENKNLPQNEAMLTSLGIIAGLDPQGRGIPVSTQQEPIAPFSLNQQEKSEILQDIGLSGTATKTPQQTRKLIFSKNPRAAISEGLKLSNASEIMNEADFDEFAKNRDNISSPVDKDIERGRVLADKIGRSRIQKGFIFTPPESAERLEALQDASRLAADLGYSDLATNLDSKFTALSGRLAKKKKTAVEQAKLDRINNRRFEAKQGQINLQLADLDRVEELIDPEFFTFTGKIREFGLAKLEKVSPSLLSEKQKDFIGRKGRFDMGVNRVFNAYRKDITGAQASFKEIQFLKKALFDTELSESQFRARFKEYKDALKRHARVLSRLRREGVEFNKDLFSNPGSEASIAYDALWAEEKTNPEGDFLTRAQQLTDQLNNSQLTEEEKKLQFNRILRQEGYDI
jgi:hypothetical protein